MPDDDSTKAQKLALPCVLVDFPGEEPLAHEGQEWHKSTTSKLSAAELMGAAETGIPAGFNEIRDHDLSLYPEYPPEHSYYERRCNERIKLQRENDQFAEKRNRLVLQTWTIVFEILYACCLNKAPRPY